MLKERRCQCPCCDYYVLESRGAYQVCPACCWEDDGSDLDDPDKVSSANYISLRQARKNFEKMGAADEAAVSLVAPASELRGLRREIRAPT